MYACSPRWTDDWISREDLQAILVQLSGRFRPSPFGVDSIGGGNYGLHFTGGEPFLNFDLLLDATQMARKLHIPSTFVETNAFWAVDDQITARRLVQLRDAGLNGVMVSVNPFVLEQVPFERTERAARLAGKVFRENVILYQRFFYTQFKRFGIKGALSFRHYLEQNDPADLCGSVELLPMGRAPYTLGHLYPKHPAEHFFDESCREELTRGWHVHVDNYCNYMTGFCGGISLGDGRDVNSICQGVELDERPILDALVTRLKTLFELGTKEYGYREREEGYISKCHLCLDLRKQIAQATDEFQELRPTEFYYRLD